MHRVASFVVVRLSDSAHFRILLGDTISCSSFALHLITISSKTFTFTFSLNHILPSAFETNCVTFALSLLKSLLSRLPHHILQKPILHHHARNPHAGAAPTSTSFVEMPPITSSVKESVRHDTFRIAVGINAYFEAALG